MRRRALTSRRSAFTLIELLVVIAVIALLLAILLPSLDGAREAARNLKCQQQMRTVHTASMLYSEDYGGVPTGRHYTERIEDTSYDPTNSSDIGQYASQSRSWTWGAWWYVGAEHGGYLAANPELGLCPSQDPAEQAAFGVGADNFERRDPHFPGGDRWWGLTGFYAINNQRFLPGERRQAVKFQGNIPRDEFETYTLAFYMGETVYGHQMYNAGKLDPMTDSTGRAVPRHGATLNVSFPTGTVVAMDWQTQYDYLDQLDASGSGTAASRFVWGD